jgi:hypothetical protein
MSTQTHEILYIDSQDTLVLPSSVASCTTTAVQMTIPVPEIMDTPSYDIVYFEVIKSLKNLLYKFFISSMY